jgi:hypothetical protein
VRALAHREDTRSKRLQELGVEVVFGDFVDLDAMFTTIKREFGHLDGIFVNAGHSEFLPLSAARELQNY